MGYQRASTGRAADIGSVSPWVAGFSVFAGTVMFITGMFEMFQGLAAIIEDEFFVIGREYAYSLDVTTWGWVHLALGAVVAIAGLAVFTGALWARVLGIILNRTDRSAMVGQYGYYYGYGYGRPARTEKPA